VLKENLEPISVAARPKPWVYGRSLARAAVSKPAGGTAVCLWWVLYDVTYRSLCDGLFTPPEESYRVWCLSVIVKPLAH